MIGDHPESSRTSSTGRTYADAILLHSWPDFITCYISSSGQQSTGLLHWFLTPSVLLITPSPGQHEQAGVTLLCGRPGLCGGNNQRGNHVALLLHLAFGYCQLLGEPHVTCDAPVLGISYMQCVEFTPSAGGRGNESCVITPSIVKSAHKRQGKAQTRPKS